MNNEMNPFDLFNLVVWGAIFLTIIVQLFASIRIVSTRTTLIVERRARKARRYHPGYRGQGIKNSDIRRVSSRSHQYLRRRKDKTHQRSQRTG